MSCCELNSIPLFVVTEHTKHSFKRCQSRTNLFVFLLSLLKSIFHIVVGYFLDLLDAFLCCQSFFVSFIFSALYYFINFVLRQQQLFVIG